jgi:hypothetical protein
MHCKICFWSVGVGLRNSTVDIQLRDETPGLPVSATPLGKLTVSSSRHEGCIVKNFSPSLLRS